MFGDGVYSGNIIQGGSALLEQLGYSAKTEWAWTSAGCYNPQSIIFGELNYPLPAGKKVTKLGAVSQNAGTMTFYIFKRVGNTLYCVKKWDYAHVGGLVYVDTEVPGGGFVVPDDGYNYVVGAASRYSTYMMMSNGYSTGRFAVSGDVAEGGSIAISPTGESALVFRYYVEHLDGSQRCVVITGAATIAPEASTRGGGALCQHLIIDGGSLTLSAQADGLSLACGGSLQLLGGGKIHVDGKALGGLVDTDARRVIAPPLRNKLSPSHVQYAQQQAALASDGAMLFLAAPVVSIASGCVVSADGLSGNANGGRVCITHGGSYTNAGTVRANGYGSGAAGKVTINKV